MIEGDSRYIGPYRLLDLLGSGGSGNVYLAEKPGPLPIRVALKTLHAGIESERARRRFELEIEIAAGLQHPGIARLLDSGTSEDGRPYLVLEHVENARPIDRFCEEEELSMRQRIELFRQVCAAVQHAHRRGIIHLDIKSSNVLIGSSDHQPLPKLIDFGLARHLLEEDDTGVDSRKDVFALGLLLRHLLRGTSLPRDLQRILEKALDEDPEHRYDSPADLSEDLERFQRGECVLAAMSDRFYRLRKYLRRHGRLIGATAVVLVVLFFALLRILESRGVILAKGEQARGFAAAARERSDQVEHLARLTRVHVLARQADEELWPLARRVVPRMDSWLQEASHLDALLARVGVLAGESQEQGWGSLLGFVPSRASWRAKIEEVQLRRARVLEAEGESLGASSAWSQAIEYARDEKGPYGGLRLAPQEELLPLGVDPHSGLLEFAHLLTGLPPMREADGRLRITSETGIVFVLLPAGSFWMGAQSDDPDGRNYDPCKAPLESVVHEVFVPEPLLFSKYELTQGQWLRMTDENPSEYQTWPTPEGEVNGWTHPVERMSWSDAVGVLARFDLDLPTVEQWEYAARAGTTTPWSCGKDRRDLQFVANVRDLAYEEHPKADAPASATCDAWYDGHAFHAPVGSFLPNPWGLFDVHGNVGEWCRDTRFEDRLPAESPEPTAGGLPREAVALGGSFYWYSVNARSTSTGFLPVHVTFSSVGVRAVRGLR